MGIKIGDGNKIRNSMIANSITSDNTNDSTITKKNFFEKHPIVCSLFIELLAGIILLFTFWENAIKWIEGLF